MNGGTRSGARWALRGVIALAAAALFVLASLLPWTHLVDRAYLLRFAALAAGLGALSVLLGRALEAALGGRSALAAAAAALAVFAPFWAWNRVGPIDVVLLHVDTLRADHCSVYGYERRTTPELERLFERGAVRFDRFIAQSGGTDKSTPAILAGIYPSMFYDPDADGRNFRVPDRFPLAGEYLREHGYLSLGFSSNPVIGERFNYPRGFTEFEELWDSAPRPADLAAHLLERIEGLTRPCFFFGLILDPHGPHTPSERFDVFTADDAPTHEEIARRVLDGKPRERYVQDLIDLYDGEILEVDAALGELVDGLEERGRLERTMLIVTSDHGEKFLEHGEYGHGGTLYEELIHVPLIWRFPSPLRFPRLEPRRRVVDGLASHVDLLPTILGFLGEPVPDGPIQGRDLTPLVYGEAGAGADWVVSEELGDGVAHRTLRSRTHKLFAFRRPDGSWRRVLVELEGGGRTIVDDSDPAGAALLEELAGRLDERVRAAREHYRPKGETPPVDPKEAARLEDLGYL